MSDLSGVPKVQHVGAYVRRLLVEHPRDEVATRLWEHVRSSSELPTEIARALVRLEGPARLRAAIARRDFPAPPDLAAVAGGEHEIGGDEHARAGELLVGVEERHQIRPGALYRGLPPDHGLRPGRSPRRCEQRHQAQREHAPLHATNRRG